MKKNIILLLSLILVLAMVFTGCSGSSNNSSTSTSSDSTAEGTTGSAPENVKDTLIAATNAGPVDLDPHGTNDQNTNDVRYQIYEPLVSVGVKGETKPCLATEWEWVDDFTINFTLREGVKFHNGNDFTAEDVIYTLKRAAESTFTSSYLANIKIDECSILEDGRLQLKLDVPVGALLSRLSMVMMIDKETWEGTSEAELLEKPIGTGPYTFVEWVQGDRIEFEAFNDYWGDEVGFKYLTMRIIPESAARALEIEAGTVDVAVSVQASDVEILEADENVELYSTPCYMITYMGYDANVAPYDNVKVRQALSYAIDRESICNIVYAGLGTPASYGRLSEVYWGYTEEGMSYYEYNPEKAKQLLAEAGYANGFDVTLSLSEAEQDQIDMSEIIQSQLGKVGINVKIEIIENATFLNSIVDGGFDMFLLNSVGSSADPGEALKSFIASRPTWSNTTRYQNADLTAMIEKGQQTIDEDDKFEIFKEVQQVVSQECPWVFLVHNRVTFAARSNIGGLVAYPSTAHYYKEARLVK